MKNRLLTRIFAALVGASVTTAMAQTADLAVSMTDSPDPVTVGSNLTYSLVVTNPGPSTASAVAVTDTLPPSVTFISATASQGSCTQNGSVITCALGTMPANTSVGISVVVRPTVSGLLTNRADVSGNENDPNSANNSATVITMASSQLPNQTNPCTLAPPGLIGWWAGESNANDRAGQLHGTLLNGTTFAPGRVGMAFSFDGVNDRVVIPDDDLLEPINGLTMEAWIKLSGTNAGLYTTIMSKFIQESPAPDWSGYELSVGGDTVRADFEVAAPGHSYTTARHPRRVLDGQWHHVCATYDGFTAILYLDGEPGEVAYTYHLVPPPSFASANQSALVIGNYTESARPFLGLIDEVSIYNRPLAAEEVASLYAAGSAGKCAVLSPVITAHPQDRTVERNTGAELAVVAFSQPLTRTIAGVVRTNLPPGAFVPARAGDGISGVEVGLKKKPGGQLSLTISRQEGATEFLNIEAGDFDLTVVPSSGATNINPTNYCFTLPPFAGSVLSPAPEAGTTNTFCGPIVLRMNPEAAPPAYQWRRNGVSVPGATNATLAFPAAATADAGLYDVVVANALGVVTSAVARLSVIEPCPGKLPGLVASWSGDGDATDLSGAGHHGALRNGATFAPGLVGSAFSLDGYDDYVDFGSSPDLASGTGAFTIECWVNFSRAADGTNYEGIVSRFGDRFWRRGGTWILGRNPAGKLWLALDEDGGWGPSFTLTSAQAVPLNEWHHVAATYDPASQIGYSWGIYLDGALIADGGNPSVLYPSPATHVTIGAWHRYGGQNVFGLPIGRALPGRVDEVSLYNRALASNEIAAIAGAGALGKCGLPFITPFGTTLNPGCNPTLAQINAALGTATATSDCGHVAPASFDSIVTSTGCARSQTRFWTLTDPCGLTAVPVARTATWTEDTAAPTLVCPPPVSVRCGEPLPAQDFLGGSVTDNCDPHPAVEFVSDVQTPAGNVIHRTYRATDACGNSIECVQTITRVDDGRCSRLLTVATPQIIPRSDDDTTGPIPLCFTNRICFGGTC